jgi:hypothetical protein
MLTSFAGNSRIIVITKQKPNWSKKQGISVISNCGKAG